MIRPKKPYLSTPEHNLPSHKNFLPSRPENTNDLGIILNSVTLDMPNPVQDNNSIHQIQVGEAVWTRSRGILYEIEVQAQFASPFRC